MDGDVAGVRILPRVVEFRDTEINGKYKINITVKNISKGSKEIRYYAPQTKYFKLKVKNPEKAIASGLEVPAVIEYTAHDAVEHADRVVVTVDGTVLEVPLKGYPSQCDLKLQGPVDFGNVVANSKVISREISIYNHGAKEGEFKIKYTGHKPVAIVPSSGKIPAKSAQVIKVEYVTKTPGHFDEVARVKLEGQESQLLQIIGNVVEGSLELLSYGTEEKMDCIQFDATYYGTDRTQSAVLFNNGPEPVCFVAILDDDATGQELGVDLTLSASALLANTDQGTPLENGQMNELTSLVTAIPNQGMLGPYEKVPIFFRFSPRWHGPRKGYKNQDNTPPRQDFALFMQLKVVGASQGFAPHESATQSNVEGSCLEVALTGTALPVLLTVTPLSAAFEFGECPVGEHVDALCTLTNSSPLLPLSYRFQRIAHFLATPPKGKIKPGQTQEVVFSFAPNQVGSFKPIQNIDIIGEVADHRNPFLMHTEVIHSVPLQFVGKSDPVTTKKEPIFNAGISPNITNEVGLNVSNADLRDTQHPNAAVLKALDTKAFRQSMKDADPNTRIAYPNDRAASIRPSDKTKTFKTPFSQIERYTFVDPDYAYTEEEAEAVAAHKQYYVDYIDYIRERRKQQQDTKEVNREYKEYNNEVDIAIKPAAGIKPKKLLLEEIKPDVRPPTPPNHRFKLLSTKQLINTEAMTSQRTIDGLNAVPVNAMEKADCAKILSPQELHQVVIGPPTIDFGEVCLKSVSQKDLNICNNLDQYIHVVVHVDCRELRQTSPLSQVVPPKSKATLPLIFESNSKGRFQRSLDYTINNFYKSHVTVFSEVVSVALELSTDNLELEPAVGNPTDAGVRGVITLRNPLNYPAEFTWAPILGERGTAFSIRPAAGNVDAFCELDCEVVFHPSFLAPDEGFFALQVHGGNTLKLRCTAKLGNTQVQFIDRRIMFGQVPLHLTTTRTAMLTNTSQNHAFFQVLDPNPFPGLSVSPIHGSVPVGGNAFLKVHLTPSAVIKFDTRIQVAIRGWKNLELRMGGTVEPPCVEIDLPSFNIGGVYCGSKSVMPFRLINRAITKSRVEFDLSRYADFTLDFPDKQTSEDITFQLMNPGLYTVTLQSEEVIECNLIFCPTEVASYDFVMPVTINQTKAPTPNPTPYPPTPMAVKSSGSVQHIINPRPVQVSVVTPRRKVIATALRQPLTISHHTLHFLISPSVHKMAVQSSIALSKSTLLVNNGNAKLSWCVDLNRCGEGSGILEQGVFKFLHPTGMPYMTGQSWKVEGELEPGATHNLGVAFCPSKPGYYEVRVPILLGDETVPYQYLCLRGELKAPKLAFMPQAVVLNAVPLATPTHADFSIHASNYMTASRVSVDIPQVECDDGSLISPLDITFPESPDIAPCCGDQGQTEPHVIPCRVTFKSDRPCSFSLYVTFSDTDGNSFQLPVTATADNCLLTCYPFLAQHRTDHQIVCEQVTAGGSCNRYVGMSLKGRKTVSCESMPTGEAVLVPCDDPARANSPRPSTTATSSNFDISTSSYEDDSSQTVSGAHCPTSGLGLTCLSSFQMGILTGSPSYIGSPENYTCNTCNTSLKVHVHSTPELMDFSTTSTWKTYGKSTTYPSTPRDGAHNKLPTSSNNGPVNPPGSSTGGAGAMGGESGASRANSRSRLAGSVFPEEDTEEGIFHAEVLLAVQRWYSSQGWPGGPNPITVPNDLRAGISKKPTEEKAKTSKGKGVESSNLKKEFKTVYDMVAHLSGKHIPGIPINNPLPTDPVERAKQVYWQHSTLLTFMRTQGASVASIKPEYLMMPEDYKTWVKLQQELEEKKRKSANREPKTKTEEEEAVEDQLFEAVSKRAWTDVLLQLYKTLVLSKITPRQFKNLPTPYRQTAVPTVDPDPLCSNVYSLGERIVLLWLNHNYEQQRQTVWKDCVKGGVPPSRWVVNLDFDLLDGLVLAAVLGAHAPFLIDTHLKDMYTHPATAEQCLHNALKVVNGLRAIGIDYDIQAIDITDPNPVSLLLLCVHLYNHLPHYLPKTTVNFEGSLHAPVTRHIKLSNPSKTPLTYSAKLVGEDACDFVLPRGEQMTVGARGSLQVAVQFISRFLRPARAVLVLVGRRHGASAGTTLVFTLTTAIDNISPKATVKCESPCYELCRVNVDVVNPFPVGGKFRVVLVESLSDASSQGGQGATSIMGARKKNKPKKVRSRTDHGQQLQTKKSGPLPREEDGKEEAEEAREDAESSMLSAFSCPIRQVELSARGFASIPVVFLPFHTGRRQCSLIVLNDTIGEFLYSVEAMATTPLATPLPFSPSLHSRRISSAAAAGGGRGMFGGDDNVVYWQCEVGRSLRESLPIPRDNPRREQALVEAAQQHMGPAELARRRATGTMTSASLMASAIRTLAASPEAAARFNKKGPVTYQVTVDSSRYNVPATIVLGEDGSKQSELKVSFHAEEAGHYPCTITLSSPDDIRVYQIECTVTPEGAEAQLEFTSPVHHPVTQNIPIVNQTNHDWPMQATIEGVGFVGPTSVLAKAFQTTYYPLLFRPHFEGMVSGQLKLINTADNVDHTFQLQGRGDKPLPLDKLVIEAKVRERHEQVIEVPNQTKRKLHYRVESDLGAASTLAISGPERLTVLPGQVTQFPLSVTPLKAGRFTGVLAFVAGNNPNRELDSDGEEIFDEGVVDDIVDLSGYRVWYALDITVSPADPLSTLDITCACQKRVAVEVGVTNPTNEAITFAVQVSGKGLSGPAEITLPPRERGVYQLVYFPAIVGKYNGKLVFYHEFVGEFWYNLRLVATPPTITTLPTLECELGRWVSHSLTLDNPTEETLYLVPVISNANNFSLERENDKPIELRPNSSVKLRLTFMPSTLGRGDHNAKVSFMCQQLGEWAYLASGLGLLPQPQEPVSVIAAARANATLIIPFRNPLDIPVRADILLTAKDNLRTAISPQSAGRAPPFCLLLRHSLGLRLGPKTTLDIPISFAPEDMRMIEAMCTVVLRREDDASWTYTPTEDKGLPLSRSHSGGIREIRWHYPIRGYPEVRAEGMGDSGANVAPTTVQCRARSRVEERLEVSLSGAAPSAGGQQRPTISTRAVTPANSQPSLPAGVVVGETLAVTEEFTYELEYPERADSSGPSNAKSEIDTAVAVSLFRQQRDRDTGLVVLTFNVVFSPYKAMKHDLELVVRAATGGLWRFPLRFHATEPPPDDTICIHAVGLNKESSVGFKLSSQTDRPTPFTAYLVAGSDRELWVTPSSGELLPGAGTLLQVHFRPSKYGKIYLGKLVVQSAESQWTYSLRGDLPDYKAPRGRSHVPPRIASSLPELQRQRHADSAPTNFIRDNLHLTTTAVSSPIKGAPILKRNAAHKSSMAAGEY